MTLRTPLSRRRCKHRRQFALVRPQCEYIQLPNLPNKLDSLLWFREILDTRGYVVEVDLEGNRSACCWRYRWLCSAYTRVGNVLAWLDAKRNLFSSAGHQSSIVAVRIRLILACRVKIWACWFQNSVGWAQNWVCALNPVVIENATDAIFRFRKLANVKTWIKGESDNKWSSISLLPVLVSEK